MPPSLCVRKLVDLCFGLAEHNHEDVPPEHIYRVSARAAELAPR
jgi:hypothetical protein